LVVLSDRMRHHMEVRTLDETIEPLMVPWLTHLGSLLGYRESNW
jgi:hypothetical protein